MRNQTRGIETTCVVVNRIIVRIRYKKNVKSILDARERSDLETILQRHDDVLKGIGNENFTYKFHDCKVFSKMDLKQGYHQVILHPDSRAVATISTPLGTVRPKRLICGAKSSQNLLDEAMFRIFGDIPKCLNQRDDILTGGTTLEDHNETLEKVLQRASDFGITLNRDKCHLESVNWSYTATTPPVVALNQHQRKRGR